MNKRKTHFYSLRRDETALSPSQQLRSAEDCEGHGPETWEEGAGRRLRLGQNRVSSSPPHPLVPTWEVTAKHHWERNRRRAERAGQPALRHRAEERPEPGADKTSSCDPSSTPNKTCLGRNPRPLGLWWWPQQQHISPTQSTSWLEKLYLPLERPAGEAHSLPGKSHRYWSLLSM